MACMHFYLATTDTGGLRLFRIRQEILICDPLDDAAIPHLTGTQIWSRGWGRPSWRTSST